MRHFAAITAGLVIGLALMFTAGCSESDHKMEMKKSLYDRLGGEPGIEQVVNSFVGIAAADPKVNFTRKGTAKEWAATPENVAKLKTHLVQFIASAAGGPQKYEGRDMKSVHAGMGITAAEFDAAAADLQQALGMYNVGKQEQTELLAVVGTTKASIVEK